MDFPILSSLILLPLLGAIFIFFSKSKSNTYLTIKYLAIFVSFANFILSLYLWYLFDPSTAEFQFLEERSWIKGFINYDNSFSLIVICLLIVVDKGYKIKERIDIKNHVGNSRRRIIP